MYYIDFVLYGLLVTLIGGLLYNNYKMITRIDLLEDKLTTSYFSSLYLLEGFLSIDLNGAFRTDDEIEDKFKNIEVLVLNNFKILEELNIDILNNFEIQQKILNVEYLLENITKVEADEKSLQFTQLKNKKNKTYIKK